ncbi:MAG: amidohydrolase [Clostridia bacterium]
MDKETAKNKVMEAIDASADRLTNFADDIWAHPELGYKEYRTAQKVMEFFDEMGLDYQSGLARTGVRADLAGACDDFKIAVMGELDSVICYEHPEADKDTGAVHACGHHGQLAIMFGTAIGLMQSGVMENLGGSLALMAVPAEEYVELDYRRQLREEGEIEFFGGKQEFIRLGILDDVDMTVMAHLLAGLGRGIIISEGSNGFLGKIIRYIGKEAHAGADPHKGINALNAALLGLMGIHAQRETFKDEDNIRVHPIITKGGDLVNNVPSEVVIESYVRGRKMEAILDASNKVNRALEGGAHAIGAEVSIDEIPGYLPRELNDEMQDIFANYIEKLVGAGSVKRIGSMGGSSDIGDISHLMPAIHPYIGGVEGSNHSRTFKVTDPEMAYVVPSKAMACMIVDLLWDGGKHARRIADEFDPIYDRDSYLKMWREVL